MDLGLSALKDCFSLLSQQVSRIFYSGCEYLDSLRIQIKEMYNDCSNMVSREISYWFYSKDGIVDLSNMSESYESVCEVFYSTFGIKSPEEQLSEDFIALVATKNLENIQTFLVSNPSIFENENSKAKKLLKESLLAVLDSKADLEIIKYLFSKGSNIQSEDLKEIAVKALEKDCSIEIFKYLSFHGNLVGLDLQKETILFGIQEGNLFLIQKALQQGPIDRVSQVEFLRATRNSEIRELIRTAEIKSELSSLEIVEIESFIKVKENPLDHLRQIGIRKDLPQRIYVTGQEAHDAGGLSKQYYSTLIKGLIDQDLVDLSSSLPNIHPSKLLECQESYQLLGLFYSLIYKVNLAKNDKYCIGNLFDHHFFDLLKIVLASSKKSEKLRAVANQLKSKGDKSDLLLANVYLNPTSENKASFAKWCGEEEFTTDHQQMIESNLMSHLMAAESFASGLTQEFKSVILTRDSKAILTSIQGEEVTVDKLMSCLEIIDPEPLTSDTENKKEWLVMKITESDVSWMKKFIKLITGNTNISSTTKIKIKFENQDQFSISTCFNTLTIPVTRIEQRPFLEALEACMGTAEMEYNTL